MAAAMLSVPKIMKSFQVMFLNPGGMRKPMAKLKDQFDKVAIPIPTARVSNDQTSAAYTQAMGARVIE